RERMSPDEVVRAVSPVEAELLRLLLLVPDLQVEVVETLAPDQLTSTLARQLYRAIVLQREPDEQGIRGGFDAQRLLDGLDEETAALAVAVMYRDGPDPRELSPERQRYAVENLVLDLEYDRLEARSEFNRAAQAEAERSGDAEAMRDLLGRMREIDEVRRSLDRRRDQARLLARPTPAAAARS
ncbi:MAG TPA: hypothetical protein VEY67_08640, partial [Candidatus Dormibacteraeota bacterium]|nr:hypothetical protein [Candidatus Dormibacteraeota bacterium]